MAGTAITSRENGKKGGRPLGAPSKMSRRKGNELAAANRTPLDVMVDNMNFWWDKAKDFGAKLESIVIPEIEASDTPEIITEKLAIRKDAMKDLQQFLAARENAQRCAVDAAPYVHPKFTSISVSKHTTKTTITMVMNKPLDNSNADYRNNGSADIVPIKRIAG